MNTLKARYRQLARDSRQEKPLAFAALFWLFIAGSLAGTVMEGLWHLLHTGVWGFRVGTLWGPFCVLYGFGAVLMYLAALGVRDRGLLRQFTVFALTGAAVEYIASLFQEACFGTMSWNYSAHAFNLGGRISLKMTLLWGVIGLLLMYALLPVLLKGFNRLGLARRRVLLGICTVFMCINLTLTCAALIRWQERVQTAEPAGSTLEIWLDQAWPDERLQARFPNMRFVRQTTP